jgi:hypothetical protein
VNQVTRKASAEVSAARTVATEDDPDFQYWFTLAEEYLKKAREEAAFADYQAANRFGRKAEDAAKRARQAALERAGEVGPTRSTAPPDDADNEPATPAADAPAADEDVPEDDDEDVPEDDDEMPPGLGDSP